METIRTLLLVLGLAQTPPHPPPDVTVLRVTADQYISMGIMEEGERVHFFVNLLYLEADTRAMEDRRMNMNPDCPPAVMAWILPDKDSSIQRYTESGKFVRYMEKLVEMNVWPTHERELLLILEDARWRWKVWDAISDIPPYKGDRTGVRLRLQKVQELVGKERFEKGEFPAALGPAALNSDYFLEMEMQVP